MSDSDISRITLETLRNRITQVFPAQIRAAVEGLSDDQLWWRPNQASNSIGNLILHLTGSLDHKLNRALGGFEYQRDRDAEFAERRHLPKDEVLRKFDAMVERADKTFQGLTPHHLARPSPDQNAGSVVFEDLANMALHIANHAGQIVWIAKMLGNK